MAPVLTLPPRRIAIVKERVFEACGYEPHAAQAEVHRNGARMKVVAAGRRLGKSQLGGHELVPECLLTQTMADRLKHDGQRREFWIVGPEYSDSEKEFRVVWNDLERLDIPMDRPGSYNSPWNGDMSISCWGGAFQVHAKSAKYPETLVGEGLSGVIMAEAAKIKERVWTKYIRPTLADFRGWALMTSTPEGKNWFYDAYQRGMDPAQPAWAAWRKPSWSNPIVFPEGATEEGIALLMRMLEPETRADEGITVADVIAAGVDPEIVDMASDMSAEKFKQEIGADFTEFVGRVFKAFDEDVHVSDLDYDPDLPVYLGIDYGWTNPFVALFIQVDRKDRVNIIAEYRATHRDINDIASDLMGFPLTAKVKLLYPDPAEPGDTEVLVKKLRVQANGATGGELKHRLEYIRQALKITPTSGLEEYKRPRLLIDRSCRELIREMNEYRWPETKTESKHAEPEKPMDKDDHGPEALGRFFRGHYGPLAGKEQKARARVRKANVG